MDEPKPPGGYKFGSAGQAVVVVPARICAWLARRTNLSEVRVRVRGVDPEVYAVLHDMHRAALEWAASHDEPASAPKGSRAGKFAEVAPPSKWVGTAQAASVLQITPRAVRLAIEEGRLPAKREGRTWKVRRTDLEHFRSARRAA